MLRLNPPPIFASKGQLRTIKAKGNIARSRNWTAKQ